MINKKLHTFLMFLGVVSIYFFAPLYGALNYNTYGTGITYYAGPSATYGPITFQSQFTATQLYWASNQLRFTNFNMGSLWSGIGFSCPNSGTLEVESVGVETATLNASIIGAPPLTFQMYVGTMGQPTNVSGVSSWSFGAGTVTMNIASSTLVYLSWAEADPADIIVVGDELLSQYLTQNDWIGFILAIYTDVLGPGFYVLLYLVPTVGTFIRAGPGVALIVLMLGYSVFVTALPSIALNLTVVALTLSGGLLLAWLFLSRRQ
jgi:hypothetical protein